MMKKLSTPCLLLLLISCSGNEHGLYPVTGEVTWQGEPATGASVFFHRQGDDSAKDQVTMAVVDEEGKFQVVCGSWGNGAPPGEYDVTIEWKEVALKQRGGPRRGVDRLKGRYADRKNPQFRITVNPEPNELDPFILTE